MDGFGNVSGFSTKFGGTPQGIIDQMRSYENVYGEQLGQPALNNIKAPEIEAYKNALTESPDFEPFMQQRQRILDLAAKAQGAGININNPRTQDEVQFSMLFNQELANYERLGRALEEQRKNYEQLASKVGTQGLVVSPTATGRYGLGDIAQSVSQVVPMEQLSTMRRAERFATQEAADEYTRGSEKIRQAFLEQGMDENNPNLQRAIRNYYQIAQTTIQDGTFDADKAAELAVSQTKAQASLISATRPSPSTQPDFDNVIDQFVRLSSSDDPYDVLNAYNYVNTQKGFGKIKVDKLVKGIEGTPMAQYKEVEINLPYAVPMQSDGVATGVLATNSKTLADKLNKGEYFHRNGVIVDKIGNRVPLGNEVYFKMVSKDEIGQDFYAAADVFNKTRKTPLGEQQIGTKYRTREAESINKPEGRIPMERPPQKNKPKITVDTFRALGFAERAKYQKNADGTYSLK